MVVKCPTRTAVVLMSFLTVAACSDVPTVPEVEQSARPMGIANAPSFNFENPEVDPEAIRTIYDFEEHWDLEGEAAVASAESYINSVGSSGACFNEAVAVATSGGLTLAYLGLGLYGIATMDPISIIGAVAGLLGFGNELKNAIGNYNACRAANG